MAIIENNFDDSLSSARFSHSNSAPPHPPCVPYSSSVGSLLFLLTLYWLAFTQWYFQRNFFDCFYYITSALSSSATGKLETCNALVDDNGIVQHVKERKIFMPAGHLKFFFFLFFFFAFFWSLCCWRSLFLYGWFKNKISLLKNKTITKTNAKATTKKKIGEKKTEN